MILIILLAPIVVRADALTQFNPSCVCNPKQKDLLEEPLSFQFGKFSSECIDSCRFRRALLLSKEQAYPIALRTGELAVGNILHLGQFLKGSIPINDISTIEIGFEEFMPKVNHIFLRFTLKEGATPIRLFNQVGRMKIVAETRSLVLSAEGVPAKGRKYNIFDAYFDNYLFVTRLVSGEEMDQWIKKLKHPLKFFMLKISPEESPKIFLKGVQQSDAKGLQETYHLFTNNCSTAALRLIDGNERLKIEDALPFLGPLGTLNALRTRNLIH